MHSLLPWGQGITYPSSRHALMYAHTIACASHVTDIPILPGRTTARPHSRAPVKFSGPTNLTAPSHRNARMPHDSTSTKQPLYVHTTRLLNTFRLHSHTAQPPTHPDLGWVQHETFMCITQGALQE